MPCYRTAAIVDLDAAKHNIEEIAKKCGSARILAVVKSDAYGHGAVEYAGVLKDYCAFFGVATMEEAKELRLAGIETPILVLSRVNPHYYEDAVKMDVRVGIFRYEDALALSEAAVKAGKTAPFHFVLDTGMSRIGFQPENESAELCIKIAQLPAIMAEGIFSHYATADEEDLTKTGEQADRYARFVDLLKEKGLELPLKHISNSAGIINMDSCYDMVRAGIVLYGLYPSKEVSQEHLALKPAMEWVAEVSYVKTLEAGREISYGGSYRLTGKTVVATIPVGYADGYPKSLSNKGEVLIKGKRAPILGRVCMDQMMVDVSHIPDVKEGDKVVLFGRDGDAVLPIEELAEKAGSFHYEQLCRISHRVPRIYIKGGKEIKEVGLNGTVIQ